MQTYPGVKVLWSDVRFKWSKSRSQYLQWSSVDWVLLVWIVVNLAKNLTMEINQVALWTEGERERENIKYCTISYSCYTITHPCLRLIQQVRM